MSLPRRLACPYFLKALGLSVPIGALAGLVGLGGGEFRLPVLLRVIGFDARTAIPVNLLVSAVTLAVALAARGPAVPAAGLGEILPVVVGLALGGMISATYGAGLVRRLNDRRLVRLIAALLGGLGLVLIAESIFALAPAAPWLDQPVLGFALAVVLGLGIGVVSSVLGVAGGELLIPALILVFGVDVKLAGSASLLIALAIVAAGLWRYHGMGLLALSAGARRITAAMSLGTVIGAITGGLMVALAPAAAIKAVLGLALILAAAQTASRHAR